MNRHLLLAALILVQASLVSCAFAPVPSYVPPTFASPDADADLAPAEESDALPNWPIDPFEAERLVQADDFTVEDLEDIGVGTTGAVRVTMVASHHDARFPMKWKPMVPPRWVDALPFSPGMLDGVNNSPRKEVVAWKIQVLFLDPASFVVPTSVVHCASMEDVRRLSDYTEPTLEDSNCKLGLFSLWLEDVTLPDPLFDPERFREDPVYARYLADFNLLTYLIKHHDGREGNFLVSKDDARRQVFAIDNGVSIGGPFYNWFVPNWSDLRVPALRRASVDRLRTIQEEDLHALLGVVAQLELDDDGVFRHAEPGPNLDDDDGIRLEDGVLQFGLEEDEIEDIWERIEDLLEDVDKGDLPTF